MRRISFGILIIICLTGLLIAGCGNPPPKTPFYLRLVAPVETNNMSYEDPDLAYQIVFTADDVGVLFKLTNLSAQDPLKIIWDNCVFTDLDGHSTRMIHKNVDPREKSKSMAPSIVAPGAYLDDYMLPEENVAWNGKNLIWYYMINPDRVTEYQGKTVSFLVCFERGGVQKNATFKFMIMLGNQPPASAAASGTGSGKKSVGPMARKVFMTLSPAQYKTLVKYFNQER